MKRLEPYDTSLNGTSWEQAWEGADHFLHRCRRQPPLQDRHATLAGNTVGPGMLLPEGMAQVKSWATEHFDQWSDGELRPPADPAGPAGQGLGWSPVSWVYSV